MHPTNLSSPPEFEELPSETLAYFNNRAVLAEQKAQAPIVAALDYALQTRNFFLLKSMLDAGMHPDTVRHQKRTALMFSVYHEDIELTEFLLSYGASAYIEDADNDSAIRIALRAGREISNLLCRHLFVKFMDDAERNPNSVYKDREFALDDDPCHDDGGEDEYLSGRKKCANCLLVWLIEFGYEDLFQTALAHGYDTFGCLKGWENSTYQPADFWESEEEDRALSDPIMDAIMAKSLIGFGTMLLCTRNNRFLRDAEIRHISPVEQALMVEKHNADLQWLNNNGAFQNLAPVRYPIFRDIEYALDDDDVEEIQEILDNGQSAYIYTSNGELLPELAHRKKLKCAKLIVSRFITEAIKDDNSLINEICFNNYTLLSLTAKYNLKEQCKTLLARGSNPSVICQNIDDEPVVIAAKRRNKEIALLLVEAGAKTDTIPLLHDDSLWEWFNENIAPVAPIKPRVCNFFTNDDDIPL